ncbi:NAD(P)H-hydrate dehydratase [Virgibacillus flavescens]|uniref:NAD(P)H-hydrate dehydratase n=1 Tax=Virgibacillus flavescens TaxID=1611422 RepID=UPI003D330886
MFIVTAKEMYDVDRHAVDSIGYDGRILMENAGRAISENMKSILSKHDQICILIGAGNNGGDGYVIARTLLNEAYSVNVVQVVPDEKITGDVRYHKDIFVKCGGTLNIVSTAEEAEKHVQSASVIIDAMLGIGVKGALREPIQSIVSLINQNAVKVIAVDIPTGLPSCEGVKEFQAIQADFTITIEAAKESAFIPHTAPYYGSIEIVKIGVPSQLFQMYTKKDTWEESDFKNTLPERNAFSHKGTHGKGLAIGGSKEMPGSIAMTAKAALRAGVGLVAIGTSEKVIQSIASACLEATFIELPKDSTENVLQYDNYDAVAIGMGLGREKQAYDYVQNSLKQASCPLIIDADGLFHIKNNLDVLKDRSAATILTPHPGEMAMLMDCTIDEIVHAPFAHAKKFSREYGVYVVLKGKYTIITTPAGKQTVNHKGNPGLAKGGSGDVLTGVILSMVMQNQSIEEAICNACFLNGKAADACIEEGHSYYDLLATDVINGLPIVLRT